MAGGPLGVLETRVMKAIWRLGRGTVHDVLGELEEGRAYTTVLTTLRNLEAKGYLRHEVDGRSHVYVPLVKEETVGRRAVRDLLQRLFDGSGARLMHALLDEEALTAEELAALRAKLRALEGGEDDDA